MPFSIYTAVCHQYDLLSLISGLPREEVDMKLLLVFALLGVAIAQKWSPPPGWTPPAKWTKPPGWTPPAGWTPKGGKGGNNGKGGKGGWTPPPKGTPTGGKGGKEKKSKNHKDPENSVHVTEIPVKGIGNPVDACAAGEVFRCLDKGDFFLPTHHFCL